MYAEDISSSHARFGDRPHLYPSPPGTIKMSARGTYLFASMGATFGAQDLCVWRIWAFGAILTACFVIINSYTPSFDLSLGGLTYLFVTPCCFLLFSWSQGYSSLAKFVPKNIWSSCRLIIIQLDTCCLKFHPKTSEPRVRLTCSVFTLAFSVIDIDNTGEQNNLNSYCDNT